MNVQFQGERTQNDDPGPLHCLIAGCTAGEFLVISKAFYKVKFGKDAQHTVCLDGFFLLISQPNLCKTSESRAVLGPSDLFQK